MARTHRTEEVDKTQTTAAAVNDPGLSADACKRTSLSTWLRFVTISITLGILLRCHRMAICGKCKKEWHVLQKS